MSLLDDIKKLLRNTDKAYCRHGTVIMQLILDDDDNIITYIRDDCQQCFQEYKNPNVTPRC